MASERGKGQTVGFIQRGMDSGVRMNTFEEKSMGRLSTEGERPVSEGSCNLSLIRSTAGHVKPGGKAGGPPSKPEYYLMTDREAVP